MQPKVRLIIDSGAYSAYRIKAPIDIDKYAQFVLANKQHLWEAVNLDVIKPNDPEASGRESLANFRYLKDKHGLLTMPVYHCGEPLSILDTMLEEAEYIGLSSSVVSVAAGTQWYNSIWPYITDSNGFPMRKFHAFGDTAAISLLNYPWYSADSTTWYVAGGLAARMFVNGKYVQFRGNSAKDGVNTIQAGEETSDRKDVWEKALWDAGLIPDACMVEMRESDKMLIRGYMNALFFLELQEKTRGIDRFNQPVSLLTKKKFQTGGIPMPDPLNLHFVITSSAATRALAILTQLGVTDLLISYFYVDERQWSEMLVPFLYDPIALCKSDPKLAAQCEILSKMLRNPVII